MSIAALAQQLGLTIAVGQGAMQLVEDSALDLTLSCTLRVESDIACAVYPWKWKWLIQTGCSDYPGLIWPFRQAGRLQQDTSECRGDIHVSG